jgi:hypothetical protein
MSEISVAHAVGKVRQGKEHTIDRKRKPALPPNHIFAPKTPPIEVLGVTAGINELAVPRSSVI